MPERANLAARIFARAAAEGREQEIALREPDREWTYAKLENQVRRVTTALRSLRVRAGDRVAVLMPDCLEAAAALLGIIYGGGVAVPLSELATANDLRDRMADCEAVAAIAHASLAPTLEEIRQEVPSLQEVIAVGPVSPGERDFLSLIRAAAPALEPASVDPADPAFLLYSDGTREGALRGVPHSHATPSYALETYGAPVLGMVPSDRVFSVVRLSTAYGLNSGLLLPLFAGAEAILLPAQPHSSEILSVVETYQPTVFFATASVYGQLARDVEPSSMRRPLANVRVCVSGAESMPPGLMIRARDILGADVLVGYGLTESFQFVISNRPGETRAGTCGKLLAPFEAQIVGGDGSAVGTMEIGTLLIRGPTVIDGYWRADGDGSPSRDGWFATLDRFMVDDDGYYIHCGRGDDQFKVGGKWVSPVEVEQALLAHEAVWECAVVGVDDQDGLVKPMAFVVPNIGHDPTQKLAAELRDHVRSVLAPYKYPRRILFVDKLPKGPTGKVLRYKLQVPPARKRAATSVPSS
jgi:benzoate-CoA ligase